MLCCSSQCEKYKECARAYINQPHTFQKSENLYSFGWFNYTTDINNNPIWTFHADCGPAGNYALFYPIKSEGEIHEIRN